MVRNTVSKGLKKFVRYTCGRRNHAGGKIQGAPQDGAIKKGASKILDRLILYIKQPSYVGFSREIRGRYRFRTQISVQNVFLNINNLWLKLSNFLVAYKIKLERCPQNGDKSCYNMELTFLFWVRNL